MRAEFVRQEWQPDLPIFAKESFLKAVGDDYGWVGGIDGAGTLRCVLPYTVIRYIGFRLIRFRVETIPLNQSLSSDEERAFLGAAMDCLRAIGDVVIPASTNTIFRTYPIGADAAPYGSYVVDLTLDESDLWHNIERVTRQNIKTAQKNGIAVRSGMEYLNLSHALIRETFRRSRLPFMSLQALERFLAGLGEYGKILIAEYRGTVQSCVIYAFSTHCAYAFYGGNIPGQQQGAAKLLHWEAIRLFQGLGVRSYDFLGARIDPARGTKQDHIGTFKRHLGGTLRLGYLWKYPLRPVRSSAYSLGVRILRGGDIVDHERHKLSRSRDWGTSMPEQASPEARTRIAETP